MAEKMVENRVERNRSVGPAAMQRPTRGRLLGATALAALVGWGVLSFTTPAWAQVPTGGTVVGGSATITTRPSQVTVNQTSNRGVIDWRGFSIGQGARVDFQQPGASSVTLNRVTGPDPSVIAGQLTANGQIVLVNGAGVLFANGAQVNVGALVASTANISNPQRFMAGGPVTFDVPSPNANAGVVNAGSVTVREGGLVGLVGNMAANHGTINARLGRVTIGGAETFTVDLAGDGLINFQIGQPVSRQPLDAQGRKVALASNTGTINADGGVVTMTARAAGSVVDNVVNVGGAIRAQAVSQQGGVLVLGGEDGGTVNITGTLDVSGKGVGQRGGQVVATAKGGKVNVAGTAVIDAAGDAGSGRVNIGGSYQGKGPIANARDTTVATGAKINADATRQGNGGTVIVWSDNATVFGGTITAKGGPKGGNGGFVETSGKNSLSTLSSTMIDTSAAYGQTGMWLLDPRDITITPGDATTISNNLATTSITLSTSDPPDLGQAGDITLQAGATITWTTTNTLTLNADRNIILNGTIVATNAAVGDRISLNAAQTDATGRISGTASIINAGGGTLVMSAGAGSINLGAAAVAGGTVDLLSSADIVVADITAAGSVTAISSGALRLGTGGLTAGGAVTVTSTGDASLGSEGINAGGDVTVTTSGLVVGPGSITSTKNGVTVISKGGIALGIGGITAAASVSIVSSKDVVVGHITAGAGVDLTVSGRVVPGAGGITAAGAVTINAAGGLVLETGSITAGGTVDVLSSGDVVIGTGGITGVGSVSVNSSANVTVGVGGIRATGSATNVTIISGGRVLVGGDITSTGTSGALSVLSAGDIVQTGGSIVASGLQVQATGTVDLSSPTNNVGVVSQSSAGTDFRYVDADTVILGNGLDRGGITIGEGRYLDISANTILITPAIGFTNGLGAITGSNDPNPSGVVVFRPTAAGTAMTIGGTTGGLTGALLSNLIHTGTLRIGSIGRAAGTVLGGATTAAESATGTITIGSLNLIGSDIQTLVLESGAGSITQTGSLSVNALATSVVGGGSVVLADGGNAVGPLAHIARLSDTTLGTQTGAYQYTSNGTVTVASVGKATSRLVGLRNSGATPGLPANAAIVTSGGNVTLTSTSSATININSPLVATNAVVTLSDPVGSINNNANGTIDVGGGGTLNLNAGSFIDLSDAPVIAGVVNFTAGGSVSLDNPNNVIGTVANTASKAGTFSSIDIESGSSLTIGSGGITAGGLITIQSAGQVLVTGNVTSSGTSGSGLAITSTGVIDGVGIRQTASTLSAPTIRLTATAGDIIQTGGNIIAVSDPEGFLRANAGGTVQLTSPTNDVTTIDGSAGTNFRYVDANAVSLGVGTVGTAASVTGIGIGDGGYVDIAANQISITTRIGALGKATARIGTIGSPGPDNPNGVTVFRPTSAGTPMVIGGGSGTDLTQDALTVGIRTGTLRIGSIGRAAGTQLSGATTATESATGAITIQGLDVTSGGVVRTLVLESAASGTAISQTAAVKVNHLATAVVGNGSVELTNPDNSVAGLAHVARLSDTDLGTQSGTYRYVDGSSIPVITVAGSGTRLIGQRDSGEAPGASPRSAILTNGGDVTLVSRTGSIEFINGLAAIGATARLNAAADIFQSAAGGVVANSLLAVAGGAVDLSTAAGLNNVRFLSGSAAGGSGDLGDFRLINAASVTVQAGGVAGDSLVATVDGVQAGLGATLELAIASGDIVVNNTTLTATDGLVLLRRVAGATGSEIILNNVSFDSGSGSPNLVVLDLTGSPVLVPGSFAGLKTSATPPNGTSAIPPGPNPDGGILLTNVNAGNTTMYLVGGAGSSIGGSGTYGLLGVYVAHSNPIALTGSVRQIDPTTSHSVTAPFSEPFDSTTFAGFYVRRRGAVVDVQTFNGCPIGSGICPTPREIEIPPTVQRPPDDPGRQVGVPDLLVIDFATDRSAPTPLGLSTVILVNQGNEYFFNVDEERRKQRAARGGR